MKPILWILCFFSLISVAYAPIDDGLVHFASPGNTNCYAGYCLNSDTKIHFNVIAPAGDDYKQFIFRAQGNTTNFVTITIDKNTSEAELNVNGFETIGSNLDLNKGLNTGDLNAEGTIYADKLVQKTGTQANHVVCWKADNSLGYCSTAVDANGSCTCN